MAPFPFQAHGLAAIGNVLAHGRQGKALTVASTAPITPFISKKQPPLKGKKWHDYKVTRNPLDTREELPRYCGVKQRIQTTRKVIYNQLAQEQ